MTGRSSALRASFSTMAAMVITSWRERARSVSAWSHSGRHAASKRATMAATASRAEVPSGKV
jgi:hypothetical protein